MMPTHGRKFLLRTDHLWSVTSVEVDVDYLLEDKREEEEEGLHLSETLFL